MSLFLVLPILAANALLVLRRPRDGVLAYVLLAMLLPHPSVAGVTVAYEILALPAVLLAALVKRPRLRFPKFHLMLGAFLCLVLLASIVGTTAYGTEFDAIRFQGLVRFLVLLGLFRELLDREGIERTLLIVVAVNAAVGFAQLVLPGSAQWTYDLYGRESQVVLERYSIDDAIPRASGTFSSPVILGCVALTALAIAWARMISGAAGRHARLLLAAGLAGIASLTKSFLLGAPLILAGGFAVLALSGGRRVRFRPRAVLLGVAATAVAIGAAVWAALYLDDLGLNVGYYASYLVNPTDALATRYGAGGMLETTMDVVRRNPLIGVGVTKVRGEFLGDSSYILLLHSTGALGVALAFVALTLVVRHVVVTGRRADLLVVAALLVSGLALPFLFSLPGALGIVYLLAPADPPGEAPA